MLLYLLVLASFVPVRQVSSALVCVPLYFCFFCLFGCPLALGSLLAFASLSRLEHLVFWSFGSARSFFWLLSVVAFCVSVCMSVDQTF